MKVILVYPQAYSPDRYLDEDFLEPLGIGYIASTAESAGHKVELIIPTSNTLLGLADKIVSKGPDVVGFQVNTSQVPDATNIASKIKKQLESCTIVFGGPHPSADPRIAESSCIDFVVVGEGEKTFIELLEALEGKKNPFAVPGIAHKSEEEFCQSSSRQRILCLDELPLPKRTFEYPDLANPAPCSLYYPAPSNCTGNVSVLGSRGCPNNCAFCSSPRMWGRSIIFRDPDKVVDEIEWLRDERGVNCVCFEDLSISANATWTRKLCELMTTRSVGVSWWCQANTNSISSDLLRVMREGGCRAIAFGVEALDAKSLKLLGKNNQTELQARYALKQAENVGMLTWSYYMIGLPHQTKDDMLESVRLLSKLPTHYLRLSVATPLPGTAWYDTFDRGDLDPDLSRYDTGSLVYPHPFVTPEEIQEIKQECYRMFYTAPAYLNRVGEMTRENPELRESFDEHLSYVEQFV